MSVNANGFSYHDEQLTKRMQKTLLRADIRKICSIFLSLVDFVAGNDLLSIRTKRSTT